MVMLYGPDGRPIDLTKDSRRALTSEVATRSAAMGFDPAEALGWLPDPDPVLVERADGVQVLDDLMADDEVTQAVQARKLKTMNIRSYGFSPGHAKGEEPTEAAARICADLEKDFEALDMDVLISGILDAPYYGFAPIELTWAYDAGRLRLVQAEPKPQEWFAFGKGNAPVFRGEFFSDAQQVHPFKFVLARHFPSYKNPYGLRLLTRCLWPVAFKRGGIEFWTRFVEKYGQPWILGHAKSGATQAEINAMANDLHNMVQDAVAVVPQGAGVQALQFDSKGAQHREFVEHQNRTINKLIRGATLTAEVGPHGSNAATKTHYELLQDFAAADAQLVTTALNNIAWVYTQVNAAAEFSPTFAYVEPEDLSARADLDQKLHSMNVDFTEIHFQRCYGLSADEFKMRGIDDTAAPAQFAERGDADHDEHQATIDALVGSVMPEAIKRNEKFMREVRGCIERAETWEDLHLMLAELLADEAGDDVDLLAAAMANAAMYGRHAVKEEGNGR